MKKTIKVFIVICLLFIAAKPVYAGSDTLKGLYITAGKGFLDKDLTGEYEIGPGTGLATDVPTIIGKAIGVGLSFLGIAFMILIIYGGFMWMFARGNDQAVGKAKEIIMAAVIGLVIVLSAYAITSFMGTNLGA